MVQASAGSSMPGMAVRRLPLRVSVPLPALSTVPARPMSCVRSPAGVPTVTPLQALPLQRATLPSAVASCRSTTTAPRSRRVSTSPWRLVKPSARTPASSASAAFTLVSGQNSSSTLPLRTSTRSPRQRAASCASALTAAATLPCVPMRATSACKVSNIGSPAVRLKGVVMKSPSVAGSAKPYSRCSQRRTRCWAVATLAASAVSKPPRLPSAAK